MRFPFQNMNSLFTHTSVASKPLTVVEIAFKKKYSELDIIKMDEDAYDEFKCPICFEIPQNEIYQCESGHTVCHQCSHSLKECPQCRVPFTGRKIRNRALENLLDKTKFDCQYKSKGCNGKIKRQEISEHEETCSFGSCRIKFCKQLGFSCEYLLDSDDITEALAHFKNSHGFIICHDPCVNICIEGIKNLNLTSKSFWTPIAFDLRESNGFVWILLNLFNSTNKTISPLCIQIKEGEGGDPTARFVVKPNENTKMPKLSWSASLVGMKQSHNLIEYPPFGLHLDTLSLYYSKEFNLGIACSLDMNASETTYNADAKTIFTFNNLFSTPASQLDNQPSAPLPQMMEALSPFEGLQGRQQEPFYVLQPVEFRHCICDVCRKPPVGEMYKCLECTDYVLCGVCMRKNEHREHVLVLISSSSQLSLAKMMLGTSRGWRQFLDGKGYTNIVLSSPVLKCQICPRASEFICLFCRPPSGYCVNCFKDFSPSHLYDNHYFAVVNTEDKSKIVLQKLISNI